jgi:glucosylceramidase
MHKGLIGGLLLIASSSAGCFATDGSDQTTSEDLSQRSTVHAWLTDKAKVGTNDMSTRDKNKMIVAQADTKFGALAPGVPMIAVDDTARMQTVEGFGASLTYVSQYILDHEAKDKDAVLRELLGETGGIGLSFLRQSVGANDEVMTSTPFSYDDGAADPTLSRFSIETHDQAMLKLLRRAIEINPDLRIIATPWSPPAWMKTNGVMYNCSGGGTRCIGHGGLRGGDYQAYASYLAKFVVDYEKNGVPIWAMTPQNEPSNNVDFPGMDLGAKYEAIFVASYLKDALARSGKQHVKMLGFDWNYSTGGNDYANELQSELGTLGKSDAFAGLAFHCYGGDAKAMGTLHGELSQASPLRDFYVTECTSNDETNADKTSKLDHGERIPKDSSRGEAIQTLIASMRNYAKSYVTFNLVHHTDGLPHIGDGCNGCIGVVSVDQKGVIYERDYAYLGHASKFVKRGAVRVDSNETNDGIENVAFVNPDGTRVLVVYNASTKEQAFQVEWPKGSKNAFGVSLPARSVATYTW